MTKRTRGQGEGNIYERQDGRWAGRVSAGYSGGKRIRVWVYGATRAEVVQKITETLRRQHQGFRVHVEKQTVAQFLSGWLEDSVKASVRPKTFRSYEQLVRIHLAPGLGRHALSRLTPAHVQAFLNEKLARGSSPRTVQYLRAVLRQALGQALKWELVVRNVATLVDPPRVPRYEIQPLTASQARKFLDFIEPHRLRALFAVAFAVGLRQGETLGLRWTAVDLERGVLHVRHSLQFLDKRFQLVEVKTDCSRRTIHLPAIAVEALRAHRTRQLEERLAAGGEWEDWGLVFTTRVGRPLDSCRITRDFKRLLKQAGLPTQRFHDCRHACASFLLAQGIPARVVVDILGHSQISLTMNTYSHVMPALRSEAAEKMDAVFRGSA